MTAMPDVIDADEAEFFDAPEVTALPLGFVVGGKYEIKKVLGMGGNGAVYEGEHATVGHRVAIKVVHAKLAEREDVIARFQREARICGTLRHPHVGQVYDVGTLDDGAPYMVMELQEGRSLADVIDDGKVPLAAIVEIVRQLLSGLGAAHRAGTIHRDIKPDNVMIVRDHSGEAIAKLVDFGISKAIEPKAGPRRVTDEGVILGSPDYMSPEQLRGDAVDLRTDIYSMGVLLYEAVTGHLPFEHESLADLFAAILRDPVVRPSALRQDCPTELEAVVLKAMHREPERRYQTSDDMSRALAEVRQAMKAAPRPMARFSDPPPRLSGVVRARRRTIDRHTFDDLRDDVTTQVRKRPVDRRPLIAAIAGATLLVGGLTVVLGSGEDDQVVVTAAQLGPANSEAAAQPASAKPAAQPDPSEDSAALTAAVVAPPSAPSAAAQPPALEGTAALEPASQRIASGSKVRARPAPARASTVREPIREADAPPANTPDVTDLTKQASNAFVLGQTAQARTLYQQIVKMAPRNADAWRGLGLSASKLGERFEATRAFQRYLALRPNAPDATRIREQLAKVQGASP